MSKINSAEIGEELPSWNLESIFSDDIPNKEMYLGKPLVILIFSLGCPACLGRAIPFANRLVVEKGDKLNVLGIHSNFEGIDIGIERLEKAQEEFYIRFPFFKDYNYDTTFLNYGAGGTPHWLIVDKKGILVYSIFGSEPNNALLRLDYLLDELVLQ